MAIPKRPSVPTQGSAESIDAFISGAPDARPSAPAPLLPADAPAPRKSGRKQPVTFMADPDLLQAFDGKVQITGLSRSQVLAVAMKQVVEGHADEALALARGGIDAVSYKG